MHELPLALTFDDVLLVPRRSRIRSRAEVATRTQLTRRIALEIPVVSANMDTVTTAPMAIALAQLGGIGVLHRFLSVEDEVAEVARVKRFRTRVIADPHTIEPRATLERARAEVERLGVSGLLVVDGDGRLAGILTARDLRAGEDPSAAVAEHMTPLDRLVTGAPGIAPSTTRSRCCTATASRSCRWSTPRAASRAWSRCAISSRRRTTPARRATPRAGCAWPRRSACAAAISSAPRRCWQPTRTRSCSTSRTATPNPRWTRCAS